MSKKVLKHISIFISFVIVLATIGFGFISMKAYAVSPSQEITYNDTRYTVIFEASYGSKVSNISTTDGIPGSTYQRNWSSYTTTYNGTEQKPTCALLHYNPNTLKWSRVAAKYRTKTYKNCRDKGSGIVKFVVSSDFTGKKDKTLTFNFTINQATTQSSFSIKNLIGWDANKNTVVIPEDRVNGSSSLGPWYTFYGGYTNPGAVVTCNSTSSNVSADFTATHTNNINAGTATITMTGNGWNVSSSVKLTKTYKIGQAAFNYNTAKFFIKDTLYNHSTNAGLLYTYTGNSVLTPDDIKVQQYFYNPSISASEHTQLTTANYSLSLSNLTNAGNGYITFTSKGNFETSTLKIPVTIIQANFANITGDNSLEVTYNESQYWTGSAIQPALTILYNNIPLKLGKDYTVEYANNINVGEGKIIITGIGNFTGTIEKSFTINESYNSNGITISNIENQIYTGKEIVPSFEVYSITQGKVLEKNIDYTVECENNIDVGTAVVRIKVNGYSTEFVRTFVITPKDISDLTANGIATYNYTGSKISQSDISIAFNGQYLSENTDFTTTYENNINVGTATVIITGTGNYTGSIKETFEIVPTNITECSVSDISEQTYTGFNIEPFVNISFNSKTLIQNNDYEINYTSNTNVGTAKITIVGKGNFVGETSVEFEIVQKDISSSVVLTYNSEITYSANEEENKTPVTVTYNNSILDEYIDYTIDYENFENVGTAKITIEFTGNYTGTVIKTYKINKFDINTIDIIKEWVAIENQDNHAFGSYEYTGESITLDFEIGSLSPDEDYTVSYSNNINVGVATVTITGKNNYTGTVKLTFEIGYESINSYVPSDMENYYEYTGSAIKPITSLDDLTYDEDYTITYLNNTNVGTATIIFEGKGNYSGKVYKYFEITPVDIEDCDINITNSTFTFTGENIEPTVTVKYNTALVKNTDYKISYSNNVNATESAEIIIEGIGNYAGITSLDFAIEAKDISNTAAISTIPNYYYSGREITPSINIYEGQTLLTQGQDFVLNYSDNVDVTSSANIEIEFIGNYTGFKTTSFEILAVDISDLNPSISIDTATYSGEEVIPDIDIEGLTLDEDYTVTYKNNIDVGTATATIVGTENYTGKLTVYFEIVPANISDLKVEKIESETYTSEEVKPEIYIDGLEEGIDFNVVYYNNIDVGTAAVIITGKGNYTGTVSSSFKITGLNIEDVEISEISEQTYTGKEVKPEVELYNGYTQLIENVDYTLYYKDNINVNGSPYVFIRGIGNYTGTTSASFTINPKTIKKTDISASYVTSHQYTGEEINPAITIKLSANGKVLEEYEDYEVNYQDNVDVGTGIIVVSFIGNYEGDDIEYKFSISKQNISTVTVSPIEDQEFTGDAIEPTIEVLCNGEIVSDDNYILRYSNNINIGKATVTITGQGNFTGTKTTTFNIIGTPIYNVSFDNIESQTYTGSAIKPTVSADGLTKNVDYKVSYYNNVNVGTAKIVVTGMNNYSNTTEIYFNITQKALSSLEFSGISNKVYTGSAITQNITILNDETKLVKNKDYTVTYSNNTNPGEAKITFKGKGNYTGTVTKTFIIKPQKVTGVSVKKKSSVYVTLKWNADSKASGYRIYNQNNKLLKTIPYNGTTSCVLKIKSGTSAFFKVYAYKTINGTKYNGVASDLVAINLKVPTPKYLKLTTKSKSITATCTKVGDATGYQYVISTKKNGKYKVVYTGRNKTKKITGLKKGVKYYVKVRTYKIKYGVRVYSNYTKPKSIKCK